MDSLSPTTMNFKDFEQTQKVLDKKSKLITSLLETWGSFPRESNFHIKSFCDRDMNVLYHFVLMRKYFMRALNIF